MAHDLTCAHELSPWHHLYILRPCIHHCRFLAYHCLLYPSTNWCKKTHSSYIVHNNYIIIIYTQHNAIHLQFFSLSGTCTSTCSRFHLRSNIACWRCVVSFRDEHLHGQAQNRRAHCTNAFRNTVCVREDICREKRPSVATRKHAMFELH